MLPAPCQFDTEPPTTDVDIVPLRMELGFVIGGAWVDRERNRFVWLIPYDGPETFAERNATTGRLRPARR